MNTISFGDGNSGLQAGTIHGPVSAQFHYYPAPRKFNNGLIPCLLINDRAERPETPPNPSLLISFGRDRDFVERGEIFDHIDRSCRRPGSRTALVGLGGVGYVTDAPILVGVKSNL